LALATAIGTSTAAPTAIISATWNIPAGYVPQRYAVQVAESNTFPVATTITKTFVSASGVIEGLKPATLYYARVQAQHLGTQSAWSATASITSASDTLPAGVPTSVAAAFVGTGDLLITWVNPASANLKDIEVKIRASSGGTIYRTIYWASAPFLYTTAMNLADTAGVGDPSLYVELASRTFSNVLGTTANTGLITKAAPSAPTVTHTWTGDTGLAGADLTLSWTVVTDAAKYRATLNSGTARETGGTTRVYTLAENIAQNGSADPSISYSVVAVDGLGQSSTAATGTATNAAPPTPTVTLTAGAVAGVTCTVTGVKAADFHQYEYVVKRDGSTIVTVESPASSFTYDMPLAADAGFHSWTMVVRQKDLFGQYSGTVTSSAVAFEPLTIASLRSGITYSDSISTAPSTLKTAMSDGIVNAGGVSYNA
jgi:hypothetical protein